VAVYPLAYSFIKIPPSPAFPQGHTAPRPIIRLALVNAERRLSCYALIDSGADHCVFPRSFLQPLGLDALEAPVAMSAGFGSAGVPTHFANLSVDLPGVIEFPVYAGFTSALDRIGLGLLGQTGFFDRFNVSFKLAERTCFIEIPEPSAA
jgi:hypothetical protein